MILTPNRHRIVTASMADLEVELQRQVMRDRLAGLDKNVRGLIHFEIEKIDGGIRNHGISFNAVTTAGFNQMLNSMFRNGTDTLYPNWYIGLISNSGYTGLAVGDVMNSHTGWTEDSTHYTGANRPAWTPGAAASKSISNSSSVNFPINNDNTVIKGIFITSDNTLGGTSGFLWSTGLFGSDQTLYNSDTLKITYVVNLN